MARRKSRRSHQHFWGQHICGLYYVLAGATSWPPREYLPQLSLSVHTKIVSSTSRTALTQTFVNPKKEPIPELRYTFPLYDGVSVVGFVCTVNDERVIRGLVKERAKAKQAYKEAVDRGETAGLLEQLPDASDVFTTTIGNVPAGATLKVQITYLGELKHDAEVDGIRFTIPTAIAPRYGSYPGQVLHSSAVNDKAGISIIVDVEMPNGSNIKSVQSPSHPISVTVGNTSAGAASSTDMSLQKASATLSLATAELGDDFVFQVVAANAGNPVAVLETHPTIPNHRALMATLVPKFSLPRSKPEIVFVCDRSGSMEGKIRNLKTALHIFLKSLPVGVKFNICCFGSHHEFLFPKGSRTYGASTLEEATRYVDTFRADFGGTEMYGPMEETFNKRYTDIDLEVFLLTDGEIWDQSRLFDLTNKHVSKSNGSIRVFTLGIGGNVSHALIEGVATAGNGFSQTVGDMENMNSKVVRMLKASLSPHVKDYILEVKYDKDSAGKTENDYDFEIVEKVIDGLTINVAESEQQKDEAQQKPISLFDPSVGPDGDITDASLDAFAGGSHVPAVSEPKLLQAPFEIPPLYPFTRTSVYLLLSPETVQQQPKSVVLRGKTQYGPLELEIPVTVLSEKGETIHQLAARKAVKEMEEGRGWIHHARDAKDPDVLLKEKYPSRFDDMVEREAVRLGVTYQVGGTWCSFVAVEANEESSSFAEVEKQPDSVFGSTEMMSESSDEFGSSRYVPKRRLGFSRYAPRRRLASAAARMSTYVPQPRIPLTSFAARKEAEEELEEDDDDDGEEDEDDDGEEDDGDDGEEDDDDDGEYGFALADDEDYAPQAQATEGESTPDRAVRLSGDKLAALVALQTFSGAWAWNAELMTMLELGEDAQKEAAGKLGGESEAAATALVLMFLEAKLAGRKDEWELLGDKAKDWLEGEVAAKGGVDGLLEEARKIVGV